MKSIEKYLEEATSISEKRDKLLKELNEKITGYVIPQLTEVMHKYRVKKIRIILSKKPFCDAISESDNKYYLYLWSDGSLSDKNSGVYQAKINDICLVELGTILLDTFKNLNERFNNENKEIEALCSNF